MSDTQGADEDVNGTASGGLVNDMPGIGSAPSSPRMVPQGIGGIARYAMQALRGSPAPQSAQQGQSPWDKPGQSQIPVQPGAPRWQGTTASFASPQGSPQPPAKFTPYIGTLPTRNWSNWGQPEQYPNLPLSLELPGISQGLSKFFSAPGQGGGGIISALALGSGKYADAYIKAYMQGQEFKAKMAKEKWIEHSMALQDQLEQRHTMYSDDMRLYSEYAGTNDLSKLGTVTIKGVSLRDRLMQDAMKTGDADIEQMLHDGIDFAKIMDYQDHRDARLKDLQKVNQKATEQQEEDAGWNNQQDPSRGTGQGQNENPPVPGQAQPQQAQPVPSGGGAPSGGAAPTMVATSGPPVPGQQPDVPSPDAQEVQAMAGLSPDQQAGLGLLRGNPVDTLPKGYDAGVAKRYSSDLQGKLDTLSGRSQGMNEDQVYNELRSISPAIANDWRRILHGAPMPGGFSQIGSRPYWQDLASLSTSVKPGWLPQDADEIKRFTESYDTIPMTQIFLRSTRMGTAGTTLLEATNRAIASGQITDNAFVNKWKQFKDNKLSDNDAWWGIFNAAQNYVSDSLAVANGGKPYEGDIRRYMDDQFYMTGPRAIRRIIQQDAVNALGVVEPLNEDFVTRRERNSPHYSERNIGLLKGLSHLQPDGSFGGADVPPELKALEMGGGQPGGQPRVHSWKDYFQ